MCLRQGSTGIARTTINQVAGKAVGDLQQAHPLDRRDCLTRMAKLGAKRKTFRPAQQTETGSESEAIP